MKRIMSWAFALILSCAPAVAGPVPAALKDSLSDAVGTFSEMISSGNPAATFDYMPPEILQVLAEQAGVSVDEVLVATRAQFTTMMENVTFNAFTMDVEAAEWQLTPDGRRGFALIPTETLATVKGAGTLKATSQTLAFRSAAGGWYLLRIDDASQVSLLQKAFPEFDGVEFPTGVTQMVRADP